MTRIEYLKYSLKLELYKERKWLISAFGIIRPDTQINTIADVKHPYKGMLIRKPWGYVCVDDNNDLQPIDDTKDLEPLYTFKERIVIDGTICSNASAETDTCIGNLLFNLISIVPAFGTKIPFITGSVSVPKIEDTVAAKLQDTPPKGQERSTEYFYTDEYIKFCDSLQFIASLSQLTTYAATYKNIKAPTGIKEFKAQLVAKYGDSISDPIVLAKFEKELTDFDKAYMAGDPSDGLFVNGKIRNIARKKMFLCVGAEKSFGDDLKATPIVNSLEEGWPLEPELYSAMMNNARMGSFSRGAETVKGGVSAKTLLRAANSFKIKDTDCQSQLGIHRKFTGDDIHQLVGRYVLDTTLVFVENKDIASNYLNRDILVRSPMYCKLEGDQLCRVCAGTKLASYPNGLSIPVTEISSILLTTFLKAMHSQVLSTAKLDIKRNFT